MEATVGLLWLLTLGEAWGSGPTGSAGWGRGEGPLLLANVREKIRLSCDGILRPLRWAWAPRFPNCGSRVSPGRRSVLGPAVAPSSRLPFLQRLRALPPGIRELELTVARGDSGTFYCIGEPRDTESRVRVTVREDLAACLPQRAPARPPPTASPVPPGQLYPPLAAGLVLGLAGLGLAWKLRRGGRGSEPWGVAELLRRGLYIRGIGERVKQGLVPGEAKTLPPAPEEPILERGDSDLDKLDHAPRWNPRRQSPDTPTIYAVVV
ncbi:megakaryocyte and platelet inhibitory receptor G6b [Tachyglossus aculeatus]|uniref:megakaryocyte and platelet inhibitory receptor G6b n=1 Tax=Tachyglossus aculeatus TaxID=9261 RepID=UPI0018F44581|nr:megakaryocyte and platelet inhibitory receptor G6b [Tachyglossus aculeatus]